MKSQLKRNDSIKPGDGQGRDSENIQYPSYKWTPEHLACTYSVCFKTITVWLRIPTRWEERIQTLRLAHDCCVQGTAKRTVWLEAREQERSHRWCIQKSNLESIMCIPVIGGVLLWMTCRIWENCKQRSNMTWLLFTRIPAAKVLRINLKWTSTNGRRLNIVFKESS